MVGAMSCLCYLDVIFPTQKTPAVPTPARGLQGPAPSGLRQLSRPIPDSSHAGLLYLPEKHQTPLFLGLFISYLW